MELNYDAQEINARMSLDEALKTYAGEIQILTLRDGTNIEIISDNYNFRSMPRMREVGYTDNKLGNVEENDNVFVEENLVDNFNQYNYQQITPVKQGLLRGKGQKKGLGKSLRKTVLKSIDGKEQEKQFENGILRNLKSNKKKENLNTIISFTENNDFLQCANCNKFFCSEEEPKTQKTTVNEAQNNQKIPTNAQQIPQKPKQNIPYPQQFQPFPQKYPQKPKQNPKQQQKGHYQQGPQFPQNPYQGQNIPHKGQKIPPNMNMGFPQMPNQQGFPPHHSPFRGGGQQKVPNQQQFYQQKHMYGGFPGFNPQMGQFRGNNQVFRARKREVNDYEEEYENYGDYDDNIADNNYAIEEVYYYPSSSKKFRSEKKASGEIPIRKNISHNIENRGLTRNLSFGYKNNIIPRTEFSYDDNNINEYFDMNDNEYYEYPNYNKRNLIPTGRTQKFNNHRVVNVKVTRNTPYQYQEYDDNENYYYDN